MTTYLSVNINKIATLRNARGENMPDVVKFAKDCERFGAQGITVHPRPDERHITRHDVFDLRPAVSTEFNIEGNPVEQFMDLVLKRKAGAMHISSRCPRSIDQLSRLGG